MGSLSFPAHNVLYEIHVQIKYVNHLKEGQNVNLPNTEIDMTAISYPLLQLHPNKSQLASPKQKSHPFQ